MKKMFILIFCLLLSYLPKNAFSETGGSYQFFVHAIGGPEKAEFVLILKNDGSKPLDFEFSSSQKYDILVRDENGGVVYQYSEGRSFLQALQTLTLNPEETVLWTEEWNYQQDGVRVTAGNYKVEAAITARQINGAVNDRPTATAELIIPMENPVFRNIKASGVKGNYTITGEARPGTGEFFYTAEDGHNELVTEQTMRTGSEYPDWSKFELSIRIPEDKLPKNGSVITSLYERTNQGGQTFHHYPVLLESFREP
ncbi:BsuPI-related putative proteinase inhibitor [Bacillus canaveralius]|uniref:BsuPI-related putative proteinase inhibitor n=1 Tax=Bacillus canaveralius TaxID=1403243 RepID=UPI000F7A989C|nr:BsuPI-related putative proteinase inhibitor [Bacillus canaveralius]RSK56034.1 hypothetical protein EJA13_02960 [Bacillus canaveralius]